MGKSTCHKTTVEEKCTRVAMPPERESLVILFAQSKKKVFTDIIKVSMSCHILSV